MVVLCLSINFMSISQKIKQNREKKFVYILVKYYTLCTHRNFVASCLFCVTSISTWVEYSLSASALRLPTNKYATERCSVVKSSCRLSALLVHTKPASVCSVAASASSSWCCSTSWTPSNVARNSRKLPPRQANARSMRPVHDCSISVLPNFATKSFSSTSATALKFN